MMKRRIPLVSSALLALVAGSGVVKAAPTLRTQVEQRGDFLLVGNTLGYDCSVEQTLPAVDALAPNSCNNTADDDSAPDLFWRADAPEAGKATADPTFGPADTRSTAILTIPSGATVTDAYLYWAAKYTGTGTTSQVTLDRPGTSGFVQSLTASSSLQAASGNAYQSVADVTTLVRQYGSGAYRVSNLAVAPFANVNDPTLFGAWAMVVFYEKPGDPFRNLALFEGMDLVRNGNNLSVKLQGFLVPKAGFNGKLGVVAYEGDANATGDQLYFSADDKDLGDPLDDGTGSPTNFFNSTRVWLGSAASIEGDLPWLNSKTPGSLAGVDLDVVDVTSKLTAGQTSALVSATSNGDQYYLGAFVTSITIFRPDLSTSSKTVRDVNGGTLLSGEILEYTLTINNTGNDATIKTVVNDLLPTGVTYVPGSLSVTSGTSTTKVTDATDTDAGEYLDATRSVVVRLGTGATDKDGGSIAIDGSVSVTFQVKVDANTTGMISNQAVVSAAGQLGAPASETYTDGNGLTAGAPPTTVFVNECDTNSDCTAPKPVCDTSASPRVCIACAIDSDCGSLTSGKVCLPNNTCVDGCRGQGGNGCPVGNVCSSASAEIGSCIQCALDSDCGGPSSGKICDSSHSCVDGCRGQGGNGCPTTLVCTSPNSEAGRCVECMTDADCGGATSAKICDTKSNVCRVGCRGVGGNNCPVGTVCTSVDDTVGLCVDCVKDSDCGTQQSGRICDASNDTCRDGCRAVSGNGCPVTSVCTSVDDKPGTCVQCTTDSHCGTPTSGRVCDANACRDGCRAIGGNGCPVDDVCSSTDTSIGTCSLAASGVAGAAGMPSVTIAGQAGEAGTAGEAGVGGAIGGEAGQNTAGGSPASIDWNQVVTQGNGCSCNVASQPLQRGASRLVGLLVAAGLALGRRKRR